MDRGDIYSYVYSSRENKWQNWTDLADMTQRDQFPEGTIVQDIVVTTVDSIRYSYIMENNIRNKIPTLFCGPTGTGKSAYTMNVIMNILEKDKYVPIECGFSAQSKAQMVQGIVDLKLDAKRGRAKREKLEAVQRWGPKNGMNAVLFVDDLNMPKQEESLAMPPVEIIRAYMDQNGWYDLKDPKHPFKEFVDLSVVCAMGPPGGGKSIISPRF
jgi:dynein heavy chain, axonemal